MIEIKGLSKKYNNNVVLDNVDLKIKKGDNVIVTTGNKNIKGQTGEVIAVIKEKNRAH